MSFNVTIGLNAETLSALNDLTAAIKGISAAGSTAAPETVVSNTAAEKPAKAETPATKAKAAEKEEAAEPVTIHWYSSASGEVGIVESEAEFKALKKADAKTVKITEDKYRALLAKQEEAEEEQEEETVEEDDAPIPTDKDIIRVFGEYLPKDLDKAERAKRAPFVKAILDRFGAPRATELPEEHRRLAINLVERKLAGEDVDPKKDGYQEVSQDDEDDQLV